VCREKVECTWRFGFELHITIQHAKPRSDPGKRLVKSDIHPLNNIHKELGHAPVELGVQVNVGI
jgi:hypothetical protein